MKQIFIFLSLVASAIIYAQADTDIVHIPDAIFKEYLRINTNINTNRDGEISYGEARAYSGSIDAAYRNIKDISGIEAFINLRELDISGNQLTSLDVSKNTELRKLKCENNQLTSLDISKNVALEELECEENQLTSLDVSKNIALKVLWCYENQLTSLDVSNNLALKDLDCAANQLTSLDVSKNIALKDLYCEGNQLTSLDVSKNVTLQDLDCAANQLTSLDVSKNIALKALYCYENQLTSLDVSKNVALTHLYCLGNQLTSLDVSKNVALQYLYCEKNQLTSLDVSKNVALLDLHCGNNKLTRLNLANGNNQNLGTMDAINNHLTCIQIDEGFTPPTDIRVDEANDLSSGWRKDDTASYNSNCNYLSTQELPKANTLKAVSPMGDILVLVGVETISKIELYNAAGQLIKTLQGNQRDVSTLQKGTYLLKVTTANGTQTLKAIKQ